jgi:hypothetical protein
MKVLLIWWLSQSITMPGEIIDFPTHRSMPVELALKECNQVLEAIKKSSERRADGVCVVVPASVYIR